MLIKEYEKIKSEYMPEYWLKTAIRLTRYEIALAKRKGRYMTGYNDTMIFDNISEEFIRLVTKCLVPVNLRDKRYNAQVKRRIEQYFKEEG